MWSAFFPFIWSLITEIADLTHYPYILRFDTSKTGGESHVQKTCVTEFISRLRDCVCSGPIDVSRQPAAHGHVRVLRSTEIQSREMAISHARDGDWIPGSGGRPCVRGKRRWKLLCDRCAIGR